MTTAGIYSQPGTNRLLASLPPAERDRLIARMEPVALNATQLIYDANQPITDVYFPLSSLISLLVVMEEGGAVEVGTAGNEGMVGLPVFLGARSTPGRALVQVGGDAVRMPAETFIQEVLAVDGPLYRLLHRYTQALFVEATQGAACNRLHPREERFCRWMLMTHDRVGRNSFPLREEFIAQMLGVSRANVSVVIATTEKAGLISYEGGTMTILDRAGLEAGSCECYRVVRAEFERVVL
jgi:CRP-like cAMP-binding protein